MNIDLINNIVDYISMAVIVYCVFMIVKIVFKLIELYILGISIDLDKHLNLKKPRG